MVSTYQWIRCHKLKIRGILEISSQMRTMISTSEPFLNFFNVDQNFSEYWHLWSWDSGCMSVSRLRISICRWLSLHCSRRWLFGIIVSFWVFYALKQLKMRKNTFKMIKMVEKWVFDILGYSRVPILPRMPQKCRKMCFCHSKDFGAFWISFHASKRLKVVWNALECTKMCFF